MTSADSLIAAEGSDLYALVLTFAIVGACMLFWIEERSSRGLSTLAALYPIILPDEVIPFNYGDELPDHTSLFGIACPRRPLFGKKKLEERVDITETLAWSTKTHAYLGYIWYLLKGLYREAIRTAYRSTAPMRWNTIWWKEFYLQHVFKPGEDVCCRPVCGPVTNRLEVCLRVRPGRSLPLRQTGETVPCVNLASYNYLGFGGGDPVCVNACIRAVERWGLSLGAPRSERAGNCSIVEELEKTVACFVGKPDAVVLAMGYATNSTIIHAVLDSSSMKVLAISDELNHRSIIEGVRLSNAKTMVFRHNDIKDLERILAQETSWDEVWIFVEGIYSMEGEFCRLRELIDLKLKYKAKLWLDEAHSIGAVGPTGRGVAELFDINPNSIDVMMGTFTKSFASAGGYVAADNEIIEKIKRNSAGFLHSNGMPPVCAAQVLAVFDILNTPEGIARIARATENANFFRRELAKMGCRVIGDGDSPVVCILMAHPQKAVDFSRLCLAKNIAVVVAGYPVTPVLLARARFCLSAAHTKRELDETLKNIDEIVEIVGCRYAQGEDLPNSASLFNFKSDRLLGRKKEIVIDNKSTRGSSQDSMEVTNDVILDSGLNDPLGLRKQKAFTQKVFDKLKEVGLGTCGPRGFYGTTQEHLLLEKKIAEFCGSESCVVYATHSSVASSVTAAFVNKEDFVFLQKDANRGIRTGLRFNRCRNVQEWESIEDLKKMAKTTDFKNPKIPNARTWIICQGGSPLCVLSELVSLKISLGAFLLLDDSLCFGTTGRTGRGSIEVFGISIRDVDILLGSLENGFASVGGFCAGSQSVGEHQTLFSGGYCFSASAPSIFPLAASEAIDWLQTKEGIERLERLHKNIQFFRQLITEESPQTVLLNDDTCYQQIIQVNRSQSSNFLQPLIGEPIGSQKCYKVNLSATMGPKDIGELVQSLV